MVNFLVKTIVSCRFSQKIPGKIAKQYRPRHPHNALPLPGPSVSRRWQLLLAPEVRNPKSSLDVKIPGKSSSTNGKNGKHMENPKIN